MYFFGLVATHKTIAKRVDNIVLKLCYHLGRQDLQRLGIQGACVLHGDETDDELRFKSHLSGRLRQKLVARRRANPAVHLASYSIHPAQRSLVLSRFGKEVSA